MYILIIIWLFIICLSCFVIYIMRNSMDSIYISNIPNLTYVAEYKDIFVNEYMNYYSINKWTYFDSNDPSTDYNILKIYDKYLINKFLFRNNVIVNIGTPELATLSQNSKPSIKIMWFKMNGISISENIIYAPQTDKYIRIVEKIINYGIIIVEPGYDDILSYNNYDKVVRYYLPLFIPVGENGIDINQNNHISLNDADLENINIIFNISEPHRLWNYTNTNLALLFIDIKID